jgi:energy-coupling factor transporter ATP-binding protein EcfA2
MSNNLSLITDIAMYLKKIVLKNIKCFHELTLDFTKNETISLWTVLLGQNGLGKSTLLQAMGVVLAGPDAMRELLPVAEGWVSEGKAYGEIEAELIWTEGDARQSKQSKKDSPYLVRYVVTGDDPKRLPETLSKYHTVPTITPWAGNGDKKERSSVTKDMNGLNKTAYAEDQSGWLGCGYGPFRRLSGGARDADQILSGRRKSARFVTLFREDAALTNAKRWLIELYNRARDGESLQQRALEQVKAVFADNLFPQPTTLHINARDAWLQIGAKAPVRFQDLSDGYRSMLALTIDLLRWLIAAFPDEENHKNCPGVVLIDELDAHAHPKWQHQMGKGLRQKFPKIQFIIATHSPFLAQVAENPEDNVVLEEQGTCGVRPRTDVKAVDTWRVDQILTELFDLSTTYNPEVEKQLKRLQQLYQVRQERPLSKSEEEEYQHLTSWRMNNIPPAIEEPGLRRIAQVLQQSVEKHSAELKKLS